MTEEVVFDWDRQARTGIPEVVFAEGKSADQIASILRQAAERRRPLLITRFPSDLCQAVRQQIELEFDYDTISRTAILSAPDPAEGSTAGEGTDEGIAAGCDAADGVAAVAGKPGTFGSVGIVCAGSSDLPVAREAQRSLEFFGIENELHCDVGVAGLWRLMAIADPLQRHAVLIAVAGMEGALFSVVAGLVPGLVIAVPTSIGYGVAAGGQAALTSALASCAPGVVCVNIDNGFGAAAAARKILLNGRAAS